MSVALVAGVIAAAPCLASCGITSSRDCAARAHCTEPVSGVSAAQPGGDGDIVGVDPQMDAAAAASTSPDGPAANSSSGAAAASGVDAARENADATGHDSGQSLGNHDAAQGNPSNDAAVQDVSTDPGTVTPPVDAAASDVANPSCDPNSCPVCVPYFLACCTADGTCGCSLLFPPGPCN